MATVIDQCPQKLPITVGDNTDTMQNSRTYFVCAFENEGEYFSGGWTNSNEITGKTDNSVMPIMLVFSEEVSNPYEITEFKMLESTPQLGEIVGCEPSKDQ